MQFCIQGYAKPYKLHANSKKRRITFYVSEEMSLSEASHDLIAK